MALPALAAVAAAILVAPPPAAAQEAGGPPAKQAPAEQKPDKQSAAAPAFELPEVIGPASIRKPDGMIVTYYRCDAVDPLLVKEELERWKSPKATITPVGATFRAGVAKNSIVRQNILRIEETEENWEVLRRVLDVIDTPQPQVYVEAKIVEITHDDDLRVGMGPSNVRVDRPVGDLFFKRVDALFANALGSSDGSSFTFGSDDKFVKFDYVLQLGKSGANAEVQSEPRIRATQGETATINVGDQEPIVKQNLSGNNVTASTDFKDVGLKLEVQPLMIGRELVRARITLRTSRVSDFRVTSTSNDRDVVNPVISEREASSVIEVISGDTVVISGLQQKAQFDDRQGIPFLMDIPYLGYLFSSTTTRDVKTELVFFVTFTVVRPGEARVVVPPAEAERVERAESGE